MSVASSFSVSVDYECCRFHCNSAHTPGEAFREAGATNPEHAVTLATLGTQPCWLFGQMVRHGVFVAATGGRYYMDERAAVAFFRRQRVRAVMMTAVLLLLFLLLWLSGLLGH